MRTSLAGIHTFCIHWPESKVTKSDINWKKVMKSIMNDITCLFSCLVLFWSSSRSFFLSSSLHSPSSSLSLLSYTQTWFYEANKNAEIGKPKYWIQGSRWRAIRAKKSPYEGWLRFLVDQKRSSSRLVILKSRPMSPPAYFLHLSFMKMSISCTCLLKSIVSIIKYVYFESDFLGK